MSNKRGIGLRGAGDHVAQEFVVAGRIDEDEVARRGTEPDLLVSMVMPWSRSVCSASSRNDHSNGMPRRSLTALMLELAVGQGAGIVQQAADQRRFAVIDMADDDDAQQRPRAAAGVGSCVTRAFMTRLPLHIAGDAQALEGVLGLVIHRRGRSARDVLVMSQFGDDLVDGRGLRAHRER